MELVKNSANRAEYKRRWKAVARAKQHGMDTELMNSVYVLLCRKGYNMDTIKECMYYFAKIGLFGFVNAWEREKGV